MKHARQVPKPFSASVPTSTVKNAVSFTSSQSCKYPCDHVCEIHAHACCWLDLQKRMWQPYPLAWSETPSSQSSELGSSSQTGLFRTRAVGDISYKIIWKIPSPVKSETEMLLHWLSIPLFIHTYYIHSYILPYIHTHYMHSYTLHTFIHTTGSHHSYVLTSYISH